TVFNSKDTTVNWSVNVGTITSSGLYTAPQVSSKQTVTVTATSASSTTVQAAATVTIMPVATSPLAVTTGSLGSAKVGLAYSQSVSASGGSAPYSWSIVSGSLPAGLQLNAATGVISGMTGETGAAAFTVQVADSSSSQQLATASLELEVNTNGVQQVQPNFF